jgi:histidinol phosphatase-like enzyme
MLHRALEPYIGKHSITVGVLQIHDEEYDVVNLIKNELGESVRIVVIENPTKGPAHTVYEIIKRTNLSENVPILIKDCDSFFQHKVDDGNYVVVSKIKKNSVLKQLAAKSFVISNDQGIISNIVEKDVVSDTFCIGGYKFNKSSSFVSAYEKLSENIDEVFISHVIQNCLLNKEIFIECVAENYLDVGTLEEWIEYNKNVYTIFCDIDGTIIQAQPKHKYHETPTILQDNVNRLLELSNQGTEIIFTTSRSDSKHKVTEEMLKKLGFKNFKLLTGLKNAKRILINDYNNANPHPRALAINLKRNTDNLRDYL